jgi:glutamate synthase (NADPH/NADH) small chain
MGDPRGFLKHERDTAALRKPSERLGDWNEHYIAIDDEKKRTQGSRCMDCGVPFCQSGCPLGNLIPDFNDLVYKGQWKEAARTLHATNNFPEFTGKICPAPCENACVLGIIEPPVTIKEMEVSIIEKAFSEGWIKPQIPSFSTGKTVGIIGGGPAGLAAAQQLNRAGHKVTVYEKSPKAGGLAQWGIPAYKLRKEIVQRRVELLAKEGITFIYNTAVGKDVTWKELQSKYDALVISTGAENPRDIGATGRDSDGVHFAMDFLAQNVSRLYSEVPWNTDKEIKATGKDVIVIGGGDTGSDCIGTSLRQGARSVTNFELLGKPTADRTSTNPWPQYARTYRVSTSMEENMEVGGKTEYNILTKEFIKDAKGKLTGVKTVEVEWTPRENGPPELNEVPGTEKVWPAQLTLLAMGFLGPVTDSLVKELDIDLDVRSNIKTHEHTKMTSVDGIFAAGDCRRGQSLVVWAIAEGREIASNVDSYLIKQDSLLPRVRLTPYKY